MKKYLVVPLAVLTVLFLAGPATAQAQIDEKIRFGIRPTLAYEDRPETFSYFSHVIKAGGFLDDAALVQNTGDLPVDLKLYAADGITAVNTGTAFAKRDVDAADGSNSIGTRSWLSFSTPEFTLAPGEEITIPFTINVPIDATPGHHIAGLVVEAPPGGEVSANGPGDGQFGAIVIQQAGVAVVIDVPGTRTPTLEITGMCLRVQSELGATFDVDVYNPGNVFIRGEGLQTISERDGVELDTVPMEMGTVLPGDVTTFRVTHPVRLGDGSYVVGGSLNYGEERERQAEEPTTSLTGIEFKVKDGQPEVGCDPEEEEQADPPFSITDIVLSPTGGGPWATLGAALGALGVAGLLALMIFLFVKRRRKKRTTRPVNEALEKALTNVVSAEMTPTEPLTSTAEENAAPVSAPTVAVPKAAEENAASVPTPAVEVVTPAPVATPAVEDATAAPASASAGAGAPGDGAISPEDIASRLRAAEIWTGEGLSLLEVCQRLGVSKLTYYRWRDEHGSSTAEQSTKFNELELENARLKELVAELSLDIAKLKDEAA